MSAIIQTNTLCKEYRIGELSIRAVREISLSIHEGEFVAIEGRSGSGKSTLLHLLSLLDRPTSGSIEVAGVDTKDFSRSRRVELRLSTFGYIFQDYALIPELTALENVLLPLFMKAGFSRSATQRGIELLEQVGLGERRNNLPNQLSGGEQQRVAIARALVNKPRVLFADEPTANLDSDTAETIMRTIESLHEQGITVLLVTHEADFARRAHRIITLADGTIVRDVATNHVGS